MKKISNDEDMFLIESKKQIFITEWMKLNRCKRHLADAPGDKRDYGWKKIEKSREE